MSKLNVFNISGEKVKDIDLNKDVWSIKPNETCVYDAINLARASLRQGTHKTKTRGEVSGGGRKPLRQKGSGKARQGSIRSPQWPGGGIVFGPTPRSYSKKMNRKEKQLALKSILSSYVKAKKVTGLDSLSFEEVKTKKMNEVLNSLKLNGKTLFIVSEINENVYLSSRNLENVLVLKADEFGILDLMSADNLVVTEEAVKYIEGALK